MLFAFTTVSFQKNFAGKIGAILDATHTIKYKVEPYVLLALKQAQMPLISIIEFLVQVASNVATYFKCLNLASTKFSYIILNFVISVFSAKFSTC